MTNSKGRTPAVRGYTATVTKRALARVLLQMREDLKLPFSAVTRDAGVPPTTLRQIETGRWTRSVSDHVRSLCELYGASEAVTRELLDATYEASRPGWWKAKQYRGIFDQELPGFEAGAELIETFEHSLLPGLLQSRGYITVLTQAAGIDEPSELERHVAARLERQAILTREDNPVALHAIIDEAALLRIPESVRDEQLRHLRSASELPNVTIQVILISAGVHAGMGDAFARMVFAAAEAGDFIYIESEVDERFLEREEEVSAYAKRFARLREAALTPEDTHSHLHQLIK